ncbi:MAG: ATP-binding cassette domain-containing protein [Paracoccaceae bacterium]
MPEGGALWQAGLGEETALLAADGLGLAVRGRRLLSGIDLAIPPGARLAILGANGAGKSLLLRLLHGLLTPTEGRLLWEGRGLDARARRAQGMAFQRPVLLRRTVRANLRFALAVRGIRGAEQRRRIDEALVRARLEHLAGRPARLLSGGEQQRLAVVRTLACAPRLLFLDEPTANLDPASTHAIEDLLLDAQAGGLTTVLVTHDAGQARRLADRAVFLHGGRSVEDGPVERVLRMPRSEPARCWRDGRLYLG